MGAIGNLLRSRPVYAIGHSATVLEAVRLMSERNIGAVPVLDGDRLVGIFSERDVITRVVAKGGNPATTLVRDVMTRDLVVADVQDEEDSCMRKMKGANCRHLPVVSGDTLVGILSLRDLYLREISEKDDKLEFLTDYLFHLPPHIGKRSEGTT